MVNPTSPPPDPPGLPTPTKTNTLACRVAKVKKYLLSVPDQRWAPSWLKIMEHQSVSTPIGILGGLFGVFFAPMVYFCGLWIIIGIHRSGVVDKLSRLRQIATYLLAATFLAITLHLGVQRVQNLLLQEKQSWISQLAAKINPSRFREAKPDNRAIAQPGLTEKQVEEAVRKALPAKVNQVAEEPKSPFNVAIEYKIVAPESRGFTGIWVGKSLGPRFVISPANLAVFMRITNVTAIRQTISRISFSEVGGGHDPPNCLDRLNTVSGEAFFTLNDGLVLRQGASIPLRADNTATSLVRFKTSNANLARAGRLKSPLLDKVASSGPIGPGDFIRGWEFFNSKCFFPSSILVQITDVLERHYKYRVDHSNAIKDGDVMPRDLTIGEIVDLSSGIQAADSNP